MNDQARRSRGPRPVGYRSPEKLTRRCDGCRGEPRTAEEVADLDIVWLVDGLGGEPAPARYCQACRPRGAVEMWECVICADGPLLAGRWAHPDDLFATGAILSWLEATGWARDGQLCPVCAPLSSDPSTPTPRVTTTGTTRISRG